MTINGGAAKVKVTAVDGRLSRREVQSSRLNSKTVDLATTSDWTLASTHATGTGATFDIILGDDDLYQQFETDASPHRKPISPTPTTVEATRRSPPKSTLSATPSTTMTSCSLIFPDVLKLAKETTIWQRHLVHAEERKLGRL